MMNIKIIVTALVLFFFPNTIKAQFNVDRLLTSGQVALHYEDYVLSIQYFNQIISLRPNLYQPWQYRAIAKYYLDDYNGAQDDATEAIRLNPYIEDIYDLRAITFIRQKKYSDAIADYTKAISIEPANKQYWYNRATCRIQSKDYETAHKDIDTIISRWSDFANAYTLNAEVYLQEKDTVQAAVWLDKALKINAYDANAWIARAYISLAKQQWRDADTYLSKAIHLRPKQARNYINRALARININNFRGAMADYDMALDIEPNNFLGHYNRGLLRQQLGDDNRAITDFDYVLKLEPDNLMALLNRAILNDKTGNIRAAIGDYTKIINQFPNFWIGLSARAKCYRKLGMIARAEADEFRILKAQMDKRLGHQTRWSKAKLKEVRKRSEIDLSKYDRIVVDDENEINHEYQSKYRGRVQEQTVPISFLPMYYASYLPYNNGLKSSHIYDLEIDRYNSNVVNKNLPIYVSCGIEQLTIAQSERYFGLIDVLTDSLNKTRTKNDISHFVFQRAVAYGMVQNFSSAISDINVYIDNDTTSYVGYWHRAVYQSMLNDYSVSSGKDIKIQETIVVNDICKAIKLNSKNPYLYYIRGNVYASQGLYSKAIEDYTDAIRLENSFAEGYYNRGIAYLKMNNIESGLKDLSKAGEQGLYKAYSVIKQITKTNK